MSGLCSDINLSRRRVKTVKEPLTPADILQAVYLFIFIIIGRELLIRNSNANHPMVSSFMKGFSEDFWLTEGY